MTFRSEAGPRKFCKVGVDNHFLRSFHKKAQYSVCHCFKHLSGFFRIITDVQFQGPPSMGYIYDFDAVNMHLLHILNLLLLKSRHKTMLHWLFCIQNGHNNNNFLMK